MFKKIDFLIDLFNEKNKINQFKMAQIKKIIDLVNFMDEIIGQPGPIKLDSAIFRLNHVGGLDLDEDIMMIGKKNKLITFRDVLKVCEKMGQQFEEVEGTDEPIAYKGASFNKKKKCYEMQWYPFDEYTEGLY